MSIGPRCLGDGVTVYKRLSKWLYASYCIGGLVDCQTWKVGQKVELVKNRVKPQ